MKSPMEILSNKMTEIQQSLDFNSDLYKNVSDATVSLWNNYDSPLSIELLCSLYHILNDHENIPHFNKIKKRKLIEEINLSILTIIQQKIAQTYQLDPPNNNFKIDTPSSSWKVGLFLVIAFLGALFSAVDGASIVQTIIGSITNPSNLVLIPIQIILAAIAVLTFCALELNTIGKPLGIRAFDLGRIFKLYTAQSILYDNIFSMMQTALIEKKVNSSELATSFKQTYQQLQQTYDNFDNKINLARAAQAQPSTFKDIVTYTCTGIAATVCGTVGALMAQSFTAYTLPLVLGAAAATGPLGLGITIAIMTLCALSAAIIYTLAQRKVMTKFVNKAWGSPTKLITNLVDKEKGIKKTISSTCALLESNEKVRELEGEQQIPNLRRRNKLTATLDFNKKVRAEELNFSTWKTVKGRQNNKSSMTDFLNMHWSSKGQVITSESIVLNTSLRPEITTMQ